MTNQIEFNTNSHLPDLAHLIRSVQRLEGNPDCFGKAIDTCDRLDCIWRDYCLKKTNPDSRAKENIIRAFHLKPIGEK